MLWDYHTLALAMLVRADGSWSSTTSGECHIGYSPILSHCGREQNIFTSGARQKPDRFLQRSQPNKLPAPCKSGAQSRFHQSLARMECGGWNLFSLSRSTVGHQLDSPLPCFSHMPSPKCHKPKHPHDCITASAVLRNQGYNNKPHHRLWRQSSIKDCLEFLTHLEEGRVWIGREGGAKVEARRSMENPGRDVGSHLIQGSAQYSTNTYCNFSFPERWLSCV